MQTNYNFKEDRRVKSAKPRPFNEQRADMVVISKANQKDLYIWCITVAVSLAIVLIFLTVALVN